MKTMELFWINDELQNAFESYFGQAAETYWRIYRDRAFYGKKYAELTEEYNYSLSSVKRIVKKVDEFFNDPWPKAAESGYDFDITTAAIYFHDEFIKGRYDLSLGAHRLFRAAIYMYQNNMYQKIPRSRVLYFSSQYKNVSRRMAAFDELRQLKIELSNGETIKIFDEIADENGAMCFQFTIDAIKYIDPWLAFFENIK